MKVHRYALASICLTCALILGSCSGGKQAKISRPVETPASQPSPSPVVPPIVSVPVQEPAPLPPPRPAPPAPAPQQKSADEVLAAAEARFLEGRTKLRAGDAPGAKAHFDAAVDLILSSGLDLRSNSRLKQLFDDLFTQLYQLESQVPAEAKEEPATEGSDKAKGIDPEQMYDPAVIDELGAVNIFPLTIEPELRHLVEEDIAHTTFGIPVIVNEQVLRWLEYYKTRGRKIMALGLQRIGLYREMIHRIFEEVGIPKDMIYLAQQESMFKPRALSSARAKGMWQFIYGTGRRYGLQQNWWVDEKLDPEKSTWAAAQHLKSLYDMFGDWYLVMAAYNAGENGIQRITDKTGIKDFWNLAERKLLYKQTVDYVPSILATMIISKHPEKYGFDVDPMPSIRSKKVEIPSPVDLSVVAESVGSTLAEIQELNPELRHLVTPANVKTYAINLPLDSPEEKVKTLAAMPVDKRVRWQRHLIEEGDSLWTISRHYRVSIEMIMDANNMSSTRIRAGRYLLIPPYTATRASVKSAASKTGSTGSKVTEKAGSASSPAVMAKGTAKLSVSSPPQQGGDQVGIAKVQPVTASKASPAPDRVSGLSVSSMAQLSNNGNDAEKKIVHTVRKGDTLYQIARLYKTTTNQVREWNGLKSNLLHPGETLLIFTPR